MSAHSFLSNFSNGFMFGMLTSTPAVGCCNPFYSPYMSFPSIYMAPMVSYTPYSMCTPMAFPMSYNTYTPTFDFSNINNSSYQYSTLPLCNTNYNTPTLWNSIPNYNFQFNYSNLNLSSNSNSQNNYSLSSSDSSYSSYSSYSGANSKVTDLYTGSVDALNKKLANRGVLRGKGAKFMEMQEKYGISASFLAAICILESGGTSNLAKTKNNVAGISEGKGFKAFSSVDECIEYTASLLKRNYVDKGLVTISEIHQKYCPPKGDSRDVNGTNGGWGRSVSGIKDGIDSAVA